VCDCYLPPRVIEAMSERVCERVIPICRNMVLKE
jgi:hypothetical protein